ncbi:MAG: F0F1 ATP synthase subunit A [Cryomorphaceae bacterium]|nr:F0F1 ATP synthase subunit A [Cryomorphaceae bacterium]MBT4236799.1 F0F1 ATP synthase subunit A [Cryomorphaceae bacterium]
MMYTKSRSFFLLLILLSASFIHAKEEEKTQTIQEEITEYIYHHVQDSHDFSLFSTKDEETGKKKYYGFPLPVILIDEGIKVFMSSKLDHGKKVVESSGKFYKLDHGKIYETNSEGYISYSDDGKITNAMPLDLSITKSVFSIFLVSLLMFFLFTSLAKSYKENNLIAKGAGRFFEPIVILIRDEIAIPSIGEEKHKRYMAFLLTVFFFIWFLNLLGLSPLGVNVTGNIAVTFGLALITFLITNLTANKTYWKHIFWMPGVPVWLKPLLAPIELLGVFIKPFSLMIRLYANILAGHIVLYSLIGLIFIFKNLVGSSLSLVLVFFISMIEILVALLQAYIFTLLSALYFGFAVQEEDH